MSRDDRHTSTVAMDGSGSFRSRMNVADDGVERAHRIAALKRRYAGLLRTFLENGEEEVLLDVYRLGREAVVEELGLLATAEMHQDALHNLMKSDGTRHDPIEASRLAGNVLSELLSAYEMSCRGYREASTAMRHLNEMLEDEVRRVAHAIHDGAGQYLACVHLSLYAISKHTPEEAKDELRHAHELLDELEKDLRRVSHELRPRVLENAGLKGAVEFLVDSVMQRTALQVDLRYELSDRPAGVIETALYRCVQELLNNITKHAHASQVHLVLLDEGDMIVCEVRDDGVGFDATEAAVQGGKQLGFLGIRERLAVLDGTVTIKSKRGEGTSVRIHVPR